MGDPARKLPSPEPHDEEGAALSPEEWDAAWSDELARRIGQIERGEVKLLDGEQVMAEMRARLAS